MTLDEGWTPELAVKFKDKLRSLPLLPQHPDVDGFMEMVMNCLEEAEVCLWAPSIFECAIRGYGSFSAPVANRAPWGECQLWIVPKCKLQFGPHKARGFLCASMKRGDEVEFFVFPLAWRHENGSVIPQWIQHGSNVATGVDAEPELLPILAAYEFMQQEYVVNERQTLPRHLRRAAETKRRPPLPEVSVVTLRRGERKEYGPDHKSQPREWSCQWLVGAHWRKPSPLMKEPRPVYVRPYLKGDPTKELRAHRETIYAVTR